MSNPGLKGATSEGELKAFLNKGFVAMAPNIYDPSKDDIALKILLISGERWLKSETANNHVRQLGADIRSSLYSIGQVKLDKDDELVTGKTFVPTKDVGDIVSVFKRLMIYLVRIQWDGIKDHCVQYKAYTSISSFDNSTQSSSVSIQMILQV